ncbi:MAG: PaaI family thioesterase [Bryobacterales bacterium]|nr:PaaI family thioesterase [Bryobacterales bacterium]
MHFTAGNDTAAARWVASSDLESFRGVVHGGLVATVLDEAMSQAAATSGSQALTCELRVRLRRPVAAGEDLEVRGWVVERRKRRILTEAALSGRDGERAHAWATFLEL